MGFTPLEGLLMGTRSGDIDPSIITYIMAKEELDIRDMNALLNKHSGLIGVSGESSDMRELDAAVKEGDKRAQNPFTLFNYRIKKKPIFVSFDDIVRNMATVFLHNCYEKEDVIEDKKYLETYSKILLENRKVRKKELNGPGVFPDFRKKHAGQKPYIEHLAQKMGYKI